MAASAGRSASPAASVSNQSPPAIQSAGESEQLLRSLLDLLDLSVGVFDVRNGRPLYHNAGYERIFELPREESQRHLDEFLSRVHPDDRQKVRGYMARQFEESTEQAYRYRAVDGSLRFIRGRTDLIRAADGRVARMVGIARDVSEEHTARAALRAREERFRSVAEAIPGVVYLAPVREQEEFLYLSESVEELTGLSASLVRSRCVSLFERVHIDDRQAVIGALSNLREHRPMLVSYRMRHEDGSWRWLEQHGQGLWDEAGELQSVGGTIFDVTQRTADEEERRALQARLFEARKLESLGVLAGGLAHDFDNLMGLLTANVELARLRLDPESPARELLDVALEAVRQASGLTRQLLAFAGRGRREVRRVDLREVIRRTGGLLRRSAPQGVGIEFSLPDTLPSLEADRAQIEQLVTNLVRNACDSMGPRGGSIRVGCEAVDRSSAEGDESDLPLRSIVLFVEDDGAGMSEAVKAQIFDPFYTTREDGHGLGLAAVAGIVRSHRGEIFVESEPGKGTRFRVVLPLERDLAFDEPLPVENGRERDSPSDLRSVPRILVVDDERIMRETACKVLGHYGYHTTQAANGREALKLVKTQGNRIDLVLLDLNMPGLGGFEVFPKLRRLQADLPIVISSAYGELESVRELERAGGVSFLPKPYGASELARSVKRALA